MNHLQLILDSNLSKQDETLTPKQRTAVGRAMGEYAIRAVATYRDNESKKVNDEAIGLIPSLLKGQFKLYVRNFYFKRAKKLAQIRADTENYKVYVIRSSEVNYKLLSTREIEHNKRIRVLDKSVGAKELTEIADFVAYPKNTVFHSLSKRVLK